MNNDASNTTENNESITNATNDKLSTVNNIDALSEYLKAEAGERTGRAIPPLEKWDPKSVIDMDLVIKANGEWWHEGSKVTRESLVSLFASILWKEEDNGITEYFLKTPVQKIRIQVEDAPLLINDVGIVNDSNESWLEFTTTTGDVVRLDDEHLITLEAYHSKGSDSSMIDKVSTADDENNQEVADDASIRPYMTVRNGLTALIGRNTFYHLTEIGELTEEHGDTILTLQSGGKSYQLSMPTN
jgi:hypothetical protein